MTEEFLEDFRQELYRTVDKIVINHKAVLDGNIDHQNRDRMNKKLFDGLVKFVENKI